MAVSAVATSACGLIAGIGSIGVADAGADAATDDEAAAPPPPPTPDAAPVDSGPPAVPTMPTPGVYTYSVSGSDKLSGILNSSNAYGPFATVTVAAGDGGCFTQSFHYRDRYDERMDMCIQDLFVVNVAGMRVQRFPLVGNVTTVQTCSPGDKYFTPAPDAGESWAHDCAGNNADDQPDSGATAYRSAGAYQFVGEETIAVFGKTVPVLHFRSQRVVSGKQTGTNFAEWYLETKTGLLVRLERDVDVNYPAYSVNYKESIDMKLLDLAPKTDGGT